MYLQKENETVNRLPGKTEEWAHQLARHAQQAVLYEAVLFPKPGLVDPVNSGSHKDMDIFTFMDSASSLYHGFLKFALKGFLHEGDATSLFSDIRMVGMEVERDMFQETKGINTHKGVIFSMGIAVAAVAFFIKQRNAHHEEFPLLTAAETGTVFDLIQQMTEDLISKDFGKLGTKKELTNGEILFIEYGFLGIRGEAEAGYPSIREVVLPYLRKQEGKRNGYSTKQIYLDILFQLMSRVEDSTVVFRGGIEALAYVKKVATEFLLEGGMRQKDADAKLLFMNEEFCKKRISPGGSADLLAVTIFFGKLEKLTLEDEHVCI